jgi:hypothetical protein
MLGKNCAVDDAPLETMTEKPPEDERKDAPHELPEVENASVQDRIHTIPFRRLGPRKPFQRSSSRYSRRGGIAGGGG